MEEDAPGIEGVQQTGAARLRGSCPRMGTYHSKTCCNPAVGLFLGTGRGPGTWPSGRDGASAFAETVAVRPGQSLGRWRTVGAGSGAAAAAAVPGAVKQKMNEVSHSQAEG